ncbi:MAG TPA: TonB-dependent receptor, partial [Pseudomonadaceae bacterium]|nr:TonB-dependent receptor [Pseudomonadaceae bacterium]
MRRKSLALAISLALLPAALAHAEEAAEELIITGVRTHTPLQLITDPKRPRQPMPAHDGADYLKTIPGFSVVRKGGTDGDPILRGMAGSRLSMLIDGDLILGGCNNRMDPPTAYVFPETFDSIRVIKGPQSVQYGPGNSAGVVLFERTPQTVEEPEWKLHSSVLAGSFGRHDEVVDLQYRSPHWDVRGSASNSASSNFEDGDGTEVHSSFERWNTQWSVAWKPDANTRLEVGTAFSDGEAAYADRGVDGSKFARENYNIKFTRDAIGPLLSSIETQAYYNYVDHVMDNYSLRSPSGMMGHPTAMNPDRSTSGGKFAVTLTPNAALSLDLGLDTQRNRHSSRNTMDQLTTPYDSLARVADSKFAQLGLFLEADWSLDAGGRIVAGARTDRWSFTDQRQEVALSMMSSVSNPLADYKRDEVLHSGFMRYEGELAG